MHRRIVIALASGAILLGGTATFAQEQKESKPPMHMHKSEMNHRQDREAAAEYKSEAAQLRQKAQWHRKQAQSYRERTTARGVGDYSNIAQHCDNLANRYADAAQEADAVASELGK